MVRQVSLLAACALLTIGNARAQTFTGTYTLPNQTGVVTLTLKQDAQGKVTGTLSGMTRPVAERLQAALGGDG